MKNLVKTILLIKLLMTFKGILLENVQPRNIYKLRNDKYLLKSVFSEENEKSIRSPLSTLLLFLYIDCSRYYI